VIRVATLLAVVTVVACGNSGSSEVGKVYRNEAQGYAVAQPDGWDVSTVREHAQLTSSSASKRKHTIVIRSTPKPAELKEGQRTTNATIAAATERVLRDLPHAKLEATAKKIEGTELAAVRFSLSFTPRGLARRYQREHAVLVGTKHIYHVIYTAPASEAIDEASFARVVATLSEEG
jgi:hypothetical protein